MTRATLRFAICVLAAAAAADAAFAQDLVTLGKQFAAASPIAWEVSESVHPALGPIVFAYGKSLVETPAGKGKVYSRAYVSCQKGTHKMAIELTNTRAPDDPSGLVAKAMPRLVCNRLAASGGSKLVAEDITARWETNEIGDMLARNLGTFPFRECVSVDVVQEVKLPPDWGPESARIAFEIAPYNRELDSIFAACGEKAAHGDGPAKPAPEKPAASEAQWRAARVTSRGSTNVRAGASLQSPVVIQLPPGSVVEVQRTGSDWWRARSKGGTPFEGYIRQDRLVFK